MESINPEKAIQLSKKLNKFSYFANPFYLLNCTFEKVNGEEIVFELDVVDNRIKPLFLPHKSENIKKFNSVSCGYDKDIKKVESLGLKIKEKSLYGLEYIYSPKEMIETKGTEFKDFRKSVNKFQRLYKFKILNDYPKSQIIKFLKKWESKKDLTKKSEEIKKIFENDLNSCIKYLDYLDEIPNKRIFIEINDNLAGFAVVVPMLDNLWAGLMQKADTSFKGISRFLYYLKSKEMQGVKYFTTGTEGTDPKLAEFKEDLNPVMKLNTYTLSYSKK